MPHTSPTPDLIASVEVCKRLRIDRSTLSRWVKNGEATPAMRLPGPRGAFLFAPAEVDRLVETKAPAA
jgi:predicted site-specific integrase-resolvase